MSTSEDLLAKNSKHYAEAIGNPRVLVKAEDAKRAMIEYARLKVKEALEEVSKKTFETYHTVCEDKTTKGVFKTQEEALDLANSLNETTDLYHDWNKVIRFGGGFDKNTILNAYPENLII